MCRSTVQEFLEQYRADAACRLDGMRGTDMLARNRVHHERALEKQARVAASAKQAAEARLRSTKRVHRASEFVPAAALTVEESAGSASYAFRSLP